MSVNSLVYQRSQSSCVVTIVCDDSQGGHKQETSFIKLSKKKPVYGSLPSLTKQLSQSQPVSPHRSVSTLGPPSPAFRRLQNIDRSRPGESCSTIVSFGKASPSHCLCDINDRLACVVSIGLITVAAILSCAGILVSDYLQQQLVLIQVQMNGNASNNHYILGKYVKTPQGNDVEEYLGIPYALAPVGEYRFADPVPMMELPINNEDYGSELAAYAAYHNKPSCIYDSKQVLPSETGPNRLESSTTSYDQSYAMETHSEDCLYLNIWVPVVKRQADVKFAVMVWFDGEGLATTGDNSPHKYNGRALAAHGDVIVVTVSHRLGILGNLGTKDNAGKIKGNFEMKDKVLALRWIYQHVLYFGGDNRKITVMTDVHTGLYLMRNETSSRLFNRLIYVNGNHCSDWWASIQQLNRTEQFLRKVKCNYLDYSDMLGCLRELDLNIILQNHRWIQANFPAAPSHQLLHDYFDRSIDMIEGIVNRNFQQQKDILTGLVTNDFNVCKNDIKSERLGENCLSETRMKIKDVYRRKRNLDLSVDLNCSFTNEIIMDLAVRCSAITLAKKLSSLSKRTYFYDLKYISKIGVPGKYVGEWIFGTPLTQLQNSNSVDDIKFSELIMTYWTNFVKTGDVNGGVLPHWPVYTEPWYRLMQFTRPGQYRVHSNATDDVCHMWNIILK